MYPRLFTISTNSLAMMVDIARHGRDDSYWILSWRRSMFAWEEAMKQSLLQDLSSVHLGRDMSGERIWLGDSAEKSSVEFAYQIITRSYVQRETVRFYHLWQVPILPTHLFFAWRMFLDRILTEVNLVRRSIAIANNVTSSLCRETAETTS